MYDNTFTEERFWTYWGNNWCILQSTVTGLHKQWKPRLHLWILDIFSNFIQITDISVHRTYNYSCTSMILKPKFLCYSFFFFPLFLTSNNAKNTECPTSTQMENDPSDIKSLVNQSLQADGPHLAGKWTNNLSLSAISIFHTQVCQRLDNSTKVLNKKPELIRSERSHNTTLSTQLLIRLSDCRAFLNWCSLLSN